jgi:hypothetical protein
VRLRFLRFSPPHAIALISGSTFLIDNYLLVNKVAHGGPSHFGRRHKQAQLHLPAIAVKYNMSFFLR